MSVTLNDMSRAWSAQMARRHELVHNPRYEDQMPAGWTAAAENIATGAVRVGQYSPERIHEQLMASPRHRANVLDARMTHLGVGVTSINGPGGAHQYVVQNFGAYPPGTQLDGPRAQTPFEQVVAHPDFSGDHRGDLFAVDRAGYLYLYRGTGQGRVQLYRAYGSGWDTMQIHAPGDWNGDQTGDLLAVDEAGDLWLYGGTGTRHLRPRVKVGNGWTGYRIVPAGDMNVDGHNDLLAMDVQGRLWLYPGRGAGRFGARVQVGNGWSGYTFMSGADFNNDWFDDLMGRDPQGRLWFYAGRLGGTFAMKQQDGTGW